MRVLMEQAQGGRAEGILPGRQDQHRRVGYKPVQPPARGRRHTDARLLPLPGQPVGHRVHNQRLHPQLQLLCGAQEGGETPQGPAPGGVPRSVPQGHHAHGQQHLGGQGLVHGGDGLDPEEAHEGGLQSGSGSEAHGQGHSQAPERAVAHHHVEVRVRLPRLRTRGPRGTRHGQGGRHQHQVKGSGLCLHGLGRRLGLSLQAPDHPEGDRHHAIHHDQP